MDLYLLITLLGLGALASITAMKLAKIRQLDPKHYKQQAEYHEEESKKWRGRYNALNKQVQIEDAQYNLDNPDDIGAAVGSIADALEGVLPKPIAKMLKNPQMLNMAVDYANKHPELAKKVIDGFIKKTTGKSGSGSGDTQTSDSDDAA